MKPHLFETGECRTGLSNPGAVASLMQQPVGSVHRDPGGQRVQDRNFRSALELRYQVYCLECSFLSPDDYPNGVESDEYDDDSEHFYAFDSHSELVGYVRLVRPNAKQRFPFQEHCSTSAEATLLPVPNHAAEISRLMVRGDYRRSRGNPLASGAAEQKNGIFIGDKRQDSLQVLLALYRQMYAYSRANGIEHWYAAMERPLARSLMRLNVAFKPIGPQTDYYGPVAPYLASLRELEAEIGARNPALLAWLQQPAPQSANTSFGDERRRSQLRHSIGLAYTLQ